MKLGSGRDADTQTVWTYLILVQFWGHTLTIRVTLELLRRSGIRSMRSRLKVYQLCGINRIMTEHGRWALSLWQFCRCAERAFDSLKSLISRERTSREARAKTS
jgi:hypothetical protein